MKTNAIGSRRCIIGLLGLVSNSFTQYTLMASVKSGGTILWIPSVFILMTKMTARDYEVAFKKVIGKFVNQDDNFSLGTINRCWRFCHRSTLQWKLTLRLFVLVSQKNWMHWVGKCLIQQNISFARTMNAVFWLPQGSQVSKSNSAFSIKIR